MIARSLTLSLFSLILFTTFASAEDTFQGGRLIEPGKTFRVGARIGTVTEMTGHVQETSRLVTRRTGSSAGDRPENYDLEELGFGDGGDVLGLTIEKQWKYATLTLKGNYSKARASQSAVRDFYLGVSSVSFAGRELEYIMIPEGEAYDAELNNYFIHLMGKWTPFTFTPSKSIEFTPWLALGIYGIVSDYSIDSGESRAIILSEHPAREYVVGGHGEGTNGGAVPEIGAGGELKIAFTDNTALEIEGHLGYVKFEGDSASIGVESRNVKKLDMEYLSIELTARLILALSDSVDMYAGLSYEHVSSEAFASADESQSTEDVLAKREKFDKDIELQYTFISAELGLLF